VLSGKCDEAMLAQGVQWCSGRSELGDEQQASMDRYTA